MRRRRLVLAVGGAAALAALAGPRAVADAGRATVGDAAEAWYMELPAAPCSSPVGCPPVSTPVPNPYPANTLHVALTLGQETATSYIQPDLSGLPVGQIPTSGRMTLPVDTSAGGGSGNVSAATIEACLLSAPFVDGTAGSTNATPPTDCSVSAPLVTGATAFHLDLTPFLRAWAQGVPEYGIGLLPAKPASGQVATWQVAFAGQNLAGSPHISSMVDLQAAGLPPAITPAAGPPAAAPTSSPPASSPIAIGASSIPLAIPPRVASPATVPVANPSFAPPSRSPVPVAAGVVAASASKGFQYPEAMLLPLAFAGGIIFAIRLLTSDATPARYKRKSA